jgi:hypothetical protein
MAMVLTPCQNKPTAYHGSLNQRVMVFFRKKGVLNEKKYFYG